MMHGRLFTSGERACRGRPSSLRPWISLPWTDVRPDRPALQWQPSCADPAVLGAVPSHVVRPAHPTAESLRDIETCLAAQAGKLYQIGFRAPVRRSTLADANERRDWRIYADFAQRSIIQARKLYAGDSTLAPVLGETVYALDSTTIDLCLSVFPWASFHATKGAVKMHTLLDLCGPIPSFIHISDGKLHDVNVLDHLIPEPGAIYLMDRAYLDFRRLRILDQAGAFFVTRAKKNLDAHRLHSRPRNPANGILSDHVIKLDGPRTRTLYPDPLRRVRFRDSQGERTLVFLTNQMTLDAETICALYKARWQVELFFKWIKQPSPDQELLRVLRECGQDADLDRCVGLCAHRHHAQAPRHRDRTLQNATGLVRDAVRENRPETST